MAAERLLDYGISLSRTCFKYYYSFYIFLLVLILVALSVIGGLVFQVVEAPPELKIIDAIIRQRESTLRQLRTKIQNQETKSEITLFIQLYEGQYIGAIRNGTVIANGQSDPLWTFEGAVYYCVTSFSLVGYGNLAPRTNLGRAIAIIYCGFTIPVSSLILGELGELLLLAFEYLWSRLFKKKEMEEEVVGSSQTLDKSASNSANYSVFTDFQTNRKCSEQEDEIVWENISNSCVMYQDGDFDQIGIRSQTKFISCDPATKILDFMMENFASAPSVSKESAGFDMAADVSVRAKRNSNCMTINASSCNVTECMNEGLNWTPVSGLPQVLDSKESTATPSTVSVHKVIRNKCRHDKRSRMLRLYDPICFFSLATNFTCSISCKYFSKYQNLRIIKILITSHSHSQAKNQQPSFQSCMILFKDKVNLYLALQQVIEPILHGKGLVLAHCNARDAITKNYIFITSSQCRLGQDIFVFVLEAIFLCGYGNKDILMVLNYFLQYKVALSHNRNHKEGLELTNICLYTNALSFLNFVLLAQSPKGRELKKNTLYQKLRIRLAFLSYKNTKTGPGVTADHSLTERHHVLSSKKLEEKSQILAVKEPIISDTFQCTKVEFHDYESRTASWKKEAVLPSSMSTMRQHVQSEGQKIVQPNSCKSSFYWIKSMLKMVFQKKVRKPDPVSSFWLGTPLRSIYIGKRLGDAIRMHRKKFETDDSSASNCKPPLSEGALTKSVRHASKVRDKNNNVSEEYDDEEEEGVEPDEGDASQPKATSSEPVLLTIATTFAFISIGSTFLNKTAENMSYFDCYWFFYISVATIGYGDIVPTDQKLFVFILVYIFIGLCLMSNLIGETSVFFSANVSKTRAITSDAIAIVHTRKQLILVERRADRANYHWGIVRDRVMSGQIPPHLIEEAVKYKAGLMAEERELVRWAYKVYFKPEQPAPATGKTEGPAVEATHHIASQPAFLTEQKQQKLSFLQRMKSAVVRVFTKTSRGGGQSVKFPSGRQVSQQTQAQYRPLQ